MKRDGQKLTHMGRKFPESIVAFYSSPVSEESLLSSPLPVSSNSNKFEILYIRRWSFFVAGLPVEMFQY